MARFTRAQRLIVLSTTLDMILEGIFVTLPSISALWPFVGPSAVPLVLLTVPLGTLIGNATLGRLADLIGRKRAYLAMLAVYSVGALMIVLANSLPTLFVGLLVAQSAIGGEIPVVLSYIVESAPADIKERLVILITNAGNAGAALAAGIAALTGTLSTAAERTALGALIAAAIGVLAFTRSMVPEPELWAQVPREARGRLPLRDRDMGVIVALLALMGISSVLTFGYLALDIGPAMFPSSSNLIIFLYFVGELVGGLVAALLVNHIGSKNFVLASFAGGLATALAAIPFAGAGGLTTFMALLLANGVFTETVWASRNVLEAAATPTSARATTIAVVRAAPYVLWAAALYPTFSFSPAEWLAFASAMWALGLAASVGWYFKGFEVVGSPVPMLPEDVKRRLRLRASK